MPTEPLASDVPNEQLRRYATGGFHLSITEHMIRTLVEIHFWNEGLSARDTKGLREPGIPDRFISSARSLIARGLVFHTPPPRPGEPGYGWHRDRLQDGYIDSYNVTDAGHLVIGLLIEAGVWQEYTRLLIPERV